MTRLTRRTLGLAGAAAFLGTATQANLALGMGTRESSGAVDLVTKDGMFRAAMRMFASLENEKIFRWHNKVRYGVVDQQVTALHHTVGALIAQMTNNGDGTISLVGREVAYHLDIETGEYLETFQNPYTGETVDVKHVAFGPNVLVMTPDGAAPQTEGEGIDLGFDIKQRIGPVFTSEESVTINFDLSAVGKDGGPSPVLYHESTVFRGNRSDVEDITLNNIPASATLQDYGNWRPWLNMGDHPGHMVGFGIGEKVRRPEDFPEKLLSLIEAHNPTYLSDNDNWSGGAEF